MTFPLPRRFRLAGCGLLTAAVQAVSLSALAQAQAESSNKTENLALEEVIVSSSYLLSDDVDMATGLGLTATETPQSVSVLTAQRILDQNLDTIADVAANAPGISIQSLDNVRNTFSARGFEIDRYQIDGVPLPWSLAGNAAETLSDVVLNDRVEVVRGATGLMTGVGDPSASINLIRKHADASELTGYMSASGGRWDDYDITADVGAPLAFDGALRGRVVAKYSEQDSYQDIYKGKDAVYYGVLEGDITQSTLLRVGFSTQQADPAGVFWGGLPAQSTDGRITDWSRSQTTSADWTQWSTENDNYFVNIIHTFDNGWRLRGDYNRLVNSWATRLIYLSGSVDSDSGILYSGVDADGQPVEAAPFLYRSKGESELNSWNFQLNGDFDLFRQEHEFALGSLHSDQTSVARQYGVTADSYVPLGSFYQWDGSYPEPIWLTPTTKVQDQTTEEKGYYGAIRISASERLKFILGARVASWNIHGFAWSGPFDYGQDDEVIPYAGALYDITDDHRVYASYTEIFKPQNARDANRKLLDPLIGESGEVGLKSVWLNGMLETSVAAFLIRQDNLAQNTGVIDPQTMETIYVAVNGTESKGFDVEAVGSITDAWRVSASYTWFEAEDKHGNDVNTDSPRELFKLFTTYDWNRWTFGGGVNWQDRIYAGVLEQDSYALVNLMARYNVNEKLSVQANIDNLFDEEYYNMLGFYGQYRYGRPTDYSVRVTYNF